MKFVEAIAIERPSGSQSKEAGGGGAGREA